MDDAGLIELYVERGSQEAFGELVRRHVDWVYGVCRREAGEMAEDVTQAVFATLARKAPKLGRRVVISGWLFKTARYASATARRLERRRRVHERKAAAMNPTEAGRGEVPLESILPRLDEAVARLSAADQEAIVLRFYRGMSHEEGAAALGISAEAMQRRVSRAVERLRKRLGQGAEPGEKMTAGWALALGVSAPPQVVQAALAMGKGSLTGSAAVIVKGMTMMRRMQMMKMTGIAAALAALAGTGYWLGMSSLRAEAGAGPVRGAATVAVAAPGTATRAGAAPASAAAADLATPRAALASLSKAIKTGDQRQVNACLTADPGRGTTPVEAALLWHVAEWRMSRATEKAFPTGSSRARTTTLTLDFLLDTLLSTTPDVPANVLLEGDTAQVAARVPQAVVDRIPANAPLEVKMTLGKWGKGTIWLAKVEGQWKVDLGKSFRVESSLTVPAEQMDQQTRAAMDELRRALEETSRGLENGAYTSETDANQALMGMLLGLPAKYPGFQGSYSFEMVPAE